MFGLKETLPLENFTATYLRHSYLKPAEWIGDLIDGEKIYIVAKPGKLLIAHDPELFEALIAIREGDGMEVKSGVKDARVTTEQMLEATGLKLDCEVVEHPADAKPKE